MGRESQKSQARGFEGAWDRAVAALIALNRNPELFYEAISLFAQSVQDAEDARKVWVEAGKPWVTTGGATGQAVVPHPLVRVVQDADRLVERYAEPVGLRPVPVGKGSAGRPKGSASAPDRREPPRITKLKAVQ